MASFEFETVDVFTETRYAGNPLAVFPDARGMSDAEMQSLATEFNLSETTFVLPPSQPEHTARVRIFNRAHEMPFAGHPMVGTAFVLARRAASLDAPIRFEVPAGLATVTLEHRDGVVTGAMVDAPKPLDVVHEIPVADIARSVGLRVDDIITRAHAPVLAHVGNTYVFAEVTRDALARAIPDVSAFRAVRSAHECLHARYSLYLYAHDEVSTSIRARMFAPLVGTMEDPATGSAAAPLAALLLTTPDRAQLDRAAFTVHQGEYVGRPSVLRVEAYRAADGIRARVGGSCVPVLRGTTA